MSGPMAGESSCQMMERLADDLRESITKASERAAKIKARIAELKAQAHPDQSQISALEQTLEVLLKKIEDDRTSLADLESVISENC
ncbi:hypothetical protein [Streptomyces sp. TN58]|uniref:hypothetical protein n=1 Tax=Streptomyces sp. TN58 TaxID=234612 RepID=UPI0009508A92|nr:hypothetical protein [Streptomyces sp. TN58]APU43687.1 hypothetical protein BSL84_32050 [Streptomyces sp. TN58]